MHEETILKTKFPKKVGAGNLANNFNKVIEIVRAIRNARAEYNVPDNKRTSLYIMLDEECDVVKENIAEIAKLAFGTNAQIVKQQPQEKCVKLIIDEVKVFIPVGELIDSEKEKERIENEIESLKFEIARSEKMLSNKGFVDKAPASLVEAEKQKLEANRAKLEKLLNN